MNIDYHVAIGGHYYSVPYTLIKQALAARLTAQTVACCPISANASPVMCARR